MGFVDFFHHLKYRTKLPKEKVWLFNSANDFAGNPKYLFLHINQHRPDMYACYICDDKKNVKMIRALGFKAVLFKSRLGRYVMRRAGVYVTEQSKEYFPPELEHTKILNLFHGVGLKEIERWWSRDLLGFNMAKKYITYNEHYYKDMCFLVTSPFMEKHFRKMLDLDESQIIRGGYPRCVYQKDMGNFSTFSHNILERQGLPVNTKLALYVPTYREKNASNFLYKGIPDINALLKVLEASGLLLIVKLHPRISNDFYFKEYQKIASINKRILFWSNDEDIYEILDKIDLGIVDYSSFYYDLLHAGVTHFIRYVFDLEEERHTMIYDYESHTSGYICKTFGELLNGLANWQNAGGTEGASRISELFWAYSSEDTCDSIIEQTLKYQPRTNLKLKDFYSFDLFDTLISRNVLRPEGIFYRVMDHIRQNPKEFPVIFLTNYPNIRMQAEASERQYVRRDKGLFEITFRAIFKRLQRVYELTDSQTEQLMQWELDAEYEDTIPCQEMVQFAEDLVELGETVVIISDMYLPKEQIHRMISKVSPILAAIPLFLSSDIGVQKTTRLLYLHVFRAYAPWRFKAWHHYGDNEFADDRQARSLGIKTHLHRIPVMGKYELGFVQKHGVYDAYLIAGMLARHRKEMTEKEYCAFAHISGYWVPYVAWAVKDAIKNGLNTLYFISRDGWFLKKIADEYIRLHQLKLKTKYIYGSRKAWRVPSLISEVDDEFFSEFGQFTGVDNYQDLLSASCLTDEEFQRLFPYVLQQTENINWDKLKDLRALFSESDAYHSVLLKKAAEQRQIVIAYLRQEIDFSEKFAFVEYWGRGYTQTCFTRLLHVAAEKDIDCIFYYYRSILPTEGRNIRLNFSVDAGSLIYVEAIFANMPYSTILGYQQNQNNQVVPVYVSNENNFDKMLFDALDRKLPEFVKCFYSLPFLSPTAAERCFADWSLSYSRNASDDKVLVEAISSLKDSVTLFGMQREFAPAFTASTLRKISRGRAISEITGSLKMSLARSPDFLKREYKWVQDFRKHKTWKGRVALRIRWLINAIRERMI